MQKTARINFESQAPYTFLTFLLIIHSFIYSVILESNKQLCYRLVVDSVHETWTQRSLPCDIQSYYACNRSAFWARRRMKNFSFCTTSERLSFFSYIRFSGMTWIRIKCASFHASWLEKKKKKTFSKCQSTI